jgi:phosphohistidine swiveling domain-containing protein
MSNKDEKQYFVIGERNSMLLHQYGTLDSFRFKIPGTKWDISKTFIYAKDLRGAHCYHKPTREKMLKILKEEATKGVYTTEFFERIHSSFQKCVADIKKFANNDFSKESNEKLVDYYLKYYKIYQLVFLPMMVAIYSSDLQEFFEEELKKVLKPGEKEYSKVIEIISLLLTPRKLTEVQKEEQMALEVQALITGFLNGKINKSEFKRVCQKPEIGRMLEKLENEHGWFHQEYVGEPKKENDYARDIWKAIFEFKRNSKTLANEDFPSFKMKAAMKKQKDFFQKHSAGKVLNKLTIAMREFALLLDYSKADLIYGIYLARPFIGEIQKRLGLTWVDTHNLTPDEVAAALKRGKLTVSDIQCIKARRKEFAMLYDQGRISIFQGVEANKLKQKLLYQDETGGVKEFSGLTAMTGRVSGNVKLVISSRDLKKFKKGDIMVTNEVTTELTSALKKAAAIVADGGGIISHTAIVAREFKIPCVVGAKIATKVLKDGDAVEIDASGSKGLVKIIK